ncbi:filamentous hemagglutinin N-terminal domain-containing protein [Xanthomonas phaseoli]|uniref:two-partner secretion domain-containing protein n=1 Tax=Xanthomonas phaseoli TaxID=1985254 RepID=UPI0002E07428|nr:filamentous hemagglutinin N-terminal domain-containing protein [Xanthomonas phaseoli]
MHATIHPATSPRTLPLRHCPLAIALAAALLAMPVSGLAQVAANQLPTGGSIAGGTGTINAANGATQVVNQTSARMALTWSAFDIGSAATMTFQQPSTSSVVLNLVQGGSPTQIFGNLTANGQVFLLNSNGVLIGSTANINVGGLVVSTLGTTASQFMNGNYSLDAGGTTVALVSNSGTINAAAGSAVLIGGRVSNSGTITATAGNITLAGADAATLTFESGGFGVLIDKPLQLSLGSEAVDNSGTLSAPGGAIQLQARAAQGLFDRLINNSGTIRASSLSNGPDGSVSLIASGGGSFDVAGGGSIDAGTGAITLSTGRGVQQTGIYTAGSLDGFIGGSATFSGANKISGLGNLDVGGNLSLSNTVALSQSGALAVTGTSQFLQSGSALSLTNGSNTFGGLFSASGNGIAVNAAGNLAIGTLTLGSNSALSLSAAGALTLPTTAINTGSANLTLSSGGSLSTRAALAGTNVDLTGRGGIALAHDVTASGTLKLTATDTAISQTAGSVAATGTSTINAGTGAITLDGASNDFQGAVTLTGGNTRISDSGALTLGAVNSNDLTATSNGALNLGSGRVGGALLATSNNGAITQSGTGSLSLVGTSNLNAGTGAITLGNSGNTFGDLVSASGRGIALNAAGNLAIGSLNLGSNSALSLRATGALTLPTTAIDTGSANLTLSSGGSLTTRAALTGTNVDLTGNAGIALAHDVTASGTLALTTTNSAITQTAGSVAATGTSTVSAGTGVIELDEATNDFQGAVTLTGGATRIADTGALTLGTLNTGNLTATSNGALNLGSGRVAGTLAASSGDGAIGQTGGLIVDATTTLDAGSGAIALIDSSNDFQGSMSLAGAGIAVRDSNDLTLSALTSNNGGTIALTAGGNLILPGTTLNNGSGDINLVANSLSLSAALLGDEVSLRANSGLSLGQNITARTLSLASSNAAITQNGGALLVSGATTVDAGTGAISLLQAGNHFTSVDLTGNGIGVTDSGNLSLAALTSTGNGAVVVTAGGTLSLPAQALTVGNSNLTLASNGGALSTAADLGGNDVTLFGRDGLTLGHTVTANTLALRSTNAAIVQNAGALAVVGASTVDAGSASIALNRGSNRFGAGISLTGTGITVADRGNLTINALHAGANGTIALTAGGALNLSAQNLDTGTADLALIANGGSMSTGGNLRGRNVKMSARDGLTIGHSITTTDALSLSSSNTAITQTAAALDVGTITTVNAGSGNVALDTAGNTFNGVVNLTAGDVQIAGNALNFGTLSTNALTANSSGALHLGSGVVRGALNGTSGNAAITQSGGLSVGGASTLNAGSGDIALTDANNDFVGAVALTGNAIAVQDRNDLSIAAVRSGANAAISLVAGGDLNLPASQIDAGTGALTLTANGGTLRTAGALRGGTVQLTGANGIALSNTVTAGNALRLNSTNAAITQAGGALLVAGDTTVDAGSGAITLEAAGNDFQGVLALTGGASSVRDANALTLGTLNTGNLQVSNSGALTLGVGLVNGDLDAASNGGAITQSGALTVTGSTRINSGGAAIALTDAGNDFQAAVSLSGGTASLRDRNALALGNLDVDALDVASGAGLDLGQGRIAGGLVARSGTAAAAAGASSPRLQSTAAAVALATDITQQGALTVAGSSLLDAGTGAIVLDAAGNDFQGTVQARGSSIAIVDRNDLAATAQASDALRLQAGGQLTTAGALSANTIALRGGSGVVLDHDVAAASLALSSGGAITQNAGSLRAGQLSGNAAGAVVLTGSGNAIDTLGDFSAQGLDLVSNRSLLVSGRVDGGPSLRLRSGGELQLGGQLSGAASWLQAVAGIRQRAGSSITAGLLSGGAGGAVVLGDAAGFIDNRVVRLGDFTASNGFSFTNGGDLLLVLANGSSYSVDAGNSAMFLSVRGNLFQDGRAPLRNGTGTFAATGQIGTQQNPIYVIGTGTQTVAAIGAPPAYFNATTVDGSLLDLAGGSGFNVPASAFAGRAQSSASRTVAFVDLSASGTPYRAFGLVRPGLRLPDDQQPACDADDPDAVCNPE